MKKIVHNYRISKYSRFTSGLLFAVISAVALILCVSYTYSQTNSRFGISLTFAIAIFSLLMGMVSMFRNNEVPKEKI
ncbi:MAG: hypothetical protein PHF63_14310 [Herbinix sp.]|nr:hypothetical protein [Herbinix sp.]